MTKPLLLLTALAGLGFATLAGAQEAEPEQSAPAAPSGIASQLDTGEVVGDSAEDATYIRSQEGDWQIQCLRVDEGEEPCQLYQLLTNSEGASVAEVSLFKVEGGGQIEAGATFIVPLETLLTQKLTIQVDGGQARRYDFSFCTQVGCYARIGFTAAEIAAFKAGQVANVTIVPVLAPDQRVTVPMSLTGFTASYDSIAPTQP